MEIARRLPSRLAISLPGNGRAGLFGSIRGCSRGFDPRRPPSSARLMKGTIKRGARAIGSLVALCVLLGLAGCSDGQSPQAGGCRDWEIGDRIQLQNSGLTCEEALGIYYLLSSDGRRPQEIEGGGEVWSCRGYPGSRSGIRFRCEMGQRHFLVREAEDEG